MADFPRRHPQNIPGKYYVDINRLDWNSSAAPCAKILPRSPTWIFSRPGRIIRNSASSIWRKPKRSWRDWWGVRWI